MISISDDTFYKSDKHNVVSLNNSLKSVFNQIKEEFSDHLDTINQNTNEIQGNYEFLCELDSKIEKLNERIDEIAMLLKQKDIIVEKRPAFEVLPLTRKEQEVFLALYILEDEKGSATYAEIARRIAYSESLVQAYITNLISKGVPVLKRYIGNDVFLNLDKNFKQIQAKENLLKISALVSASLIKN